MIRTKGHFRNQKLIYSLTFAEESQLLSAIGEMRKKLNETNRKQLAVAASGTYDYHNVRKVLEIVFTTSQTEVVLYVPKSFKNKMDGCSNQKKHKNPPNNDGQQEAPGQQKPGQWLTQRKSYYTILVRPQDGISYADTLKKIKTSIQPTDYGV